MDSWGWRPYVPVAQRRKNGEKAAAKLLKKGEKIEPININGRAIAKSFWGKAWCEHLESFSDYVNRLPRGRTYVRNGSVIHLKIEEGKVTALVQGSELYKIAIEIESLESKKWKAISERCSGEVGSVIELMQGKLSAEVMKIITAKRQGLFPEPKEISLNCSCPDSAYLCKHLAAVMYGIGSRLDSEPELLFRLRKVDHMELISKAAIKTSGKGVQSSKALEGQDLSNLFGIDLDGEGGSDGDAEVDGHSDNDTKAVKINEGIVKRPRRSLPKQVLQQVKPRKVKATGPSTNKSLTRKKAKPNLGETTKRKTKRRSSVKVV